jgi:hypothetical protein
VTFIHGIGNKLPHDPLLDAWERSLAVDDGIDLGTLGVTSEMVYWADVMYPEPKEESFESAADMPAVDQDPHVVDARDLDPAEQAWIEEFSDSLGISGVEEDDADVDSPAIPDDDADDGLERVPLPRFVKRRVLQTLLRDVHHYLFNAIHSPRPGIEFEVQAEIRDRMLEVLTRGANTSSPHVVVSHSMGTVIAYDCLKRVPDCPPIDMLVTLGSPLGRHEIPDELQPGWTLDDGYPDRVLSRWVNVFDRLDPVVGVYPHLKYLYRRHGEETVVDVNEQNWGRWRHDISKYLHGEELRRHLADALEVPYGH